MIDDHDPDDRDAGVMILTAVRAQWRAKHPEASEERLTEIIRADKMAVVEYLKTLPQALWERWHHEQAVDLTDKVLTELVAEGRAETGIGDDGELWIAPTKGSEAAFQRLVDQRLNQKCRQRARDAHRRFQTL